VDSSLLILFCEYYKLQYHYSTFSSLLSLSPFAVGILFLNTLSRATLKNFMTPCNGAGSHIWNILSLYLMSLCLLWVFKIQRRGPEQMYWSVSTRGRDKHCCSIRCQCIIYYNALSNRLTSWYHVAPHPM